MAEERGSRRDGGGAEGTEGTAEASGDRGGTARGTRQTQEGLSTRAN